MNKLFFTLFIATIVSLLACSETSHTNSFSDEDGEFADSSFYSSSGTSNRADIDYDGEIVMVCKFIFNKSGCERDCAMIPRSA